MYFAGHTSALFENTQSIAIIGAKDKLGQDVDRVGRYFIKMGYTVYPVHPMRTNIWGLNTYKSLLEIPEHIDIINLFRASKYCILHAKETILLKNPPKVFWMQQGIYSTEAKTLLAKQKISVVENLCIMAEYSHLMEK